MVRSRQQGFCSRLATPDHVVGEKTPNEHRLKAGDEAQTPRRGVLAQSRLDAAARHLPVSAPAANRRRMVVTGAEKQEDNAKPEDCGYIKNECRENTGAAQYDKSPWN